MTLQTRLNKIKQINDEKIVEYQQTLNSLTNQIKMKMNKNKIENDSKIETTNIQKVQIKYPIGIKDIRSNRNYEIKDTFNNKIIYFKTNVFELLSQQTIERKISDEIYIIEPFIEIQYGTLKKENELTIIKIKYIYEKKYINQKVSLVDLGFDYMITLMDANYTNLYYFENEFGKFRIDLDIELV